VLRWETELLETAIHEALNGLHAYLWKTGQWQPTAEASILETVLPHAKVHLGFYASRIPRPTYAEPETCNAQLNDVSALDSSDASASGWRRLAYLESHWVRTRNNYVPPELQVSVYAGAVSGFGQARLGPDSLPFLRCSVDGWWSGGFRGPDEGPIVGMDNVLDWPGYSCVFVPPGHLLLPFQFSPPQINGPLVWNDTSGKPAVRFRQWRILDSHQLFTDSSSHEGMDLIVRPDVFAQLEANCRAPIRELLMLRETAA